eukprot:tig00001027_g6399.t1
MLRPLLAAGLLRPARRIPRLYNPILSAPARAACSVVDSRIFKPKLEFIQPKVVHTTYRVTNAEGRVLEGAEEPDVPEALAVRMYEAMVRLNVQDSILYEAQRQGRISFMMTSFGEEATQIGSAAALDPEDEVFAQYREHGVIMWRGFTLDQILNQCVGNELGHGKGRQMPIHYGSAALRYHTVSSPLATQIPQAAGAGYALKLQGRPLCAVAYFGEGAASEGDFHAGLNFAATLECPVLFICRNNGYAISTSAHEQFRGDGIVSRASGYGMLGIRVDGADLWAVYNAVRAAREVAVREKRPVLIETMSYRLGHHSTSDDSTRYRGADEIAAWRQLANPLERTRGYLEGRGWWDGAREEALRSDARAAVLAALARAELFSDVLAGPEPWNLAEQRQELAVHLARHPEAYPLAQHRGGLAGL